MIPALQAVTKMDRAATILVFWHVMHIERMARLRALMWLNAHLEQEFTALWDRLEAARLLRNTVLHAHWKAGGAPSVIRSSEIKASGKTVEMSPEDFPDKDFTLNDLRQEGRKFVRLDNDFRKFFRQNFGAKFPPRRK